MEENLEYLNPNYAHYYKGYKYHKNEYGDEFWYDNNGIKRKEITYHQNGTKGVEIYFNENGECHNEDGCGHIEWDENSNVKGQYYYIDGEYISKNLFNYIKSLTDYSKVTRLEVIDENGRSYVNKNKDNIIELSLQDDGKTLKVFVTQNKK